MKKIFNIKVSECPPAELFEKLLHHVHHNSLDHGLYDLAREENTVSGFFWARETVIVSNELDLHTLGEPLTFYKVNKFAFTLQSIKKFEYLLIIDSSSRSIKPLLKLLQEATGTKVFISQIEISLTNLVTHLKSSSSTQITITHAYTSNQVISKSEKISFSIYSIENALTAAKKIMNGSTIRFDRIRMQTSSQGDILKIDIKSNCLYSISASNSEIEKLLLRYVLSTQNEL
ncbi:hypothetical protein [Pseudomonas aeruginosa]|uniref:hypothetical protein n=1 Tax=Pseudomonas aeruginosa TaxID=287 RepID=UPI000A46B55E|nr:hypothetical protein [Pseudomonas aeruginosa]MCF8576633.1 hypothetical protein [Pseudomonas aeruginosa]MCG7143847.1 hypothetical protein [Pseudomonas aeruginosa]MCG7148698.1 hypothetical protein [Pseudomonas aeruginosa]MCO4040686.1 hypothetical protein [Pseudomonas aeruginosa]MDI2414093.1 hypothetical protein [Pseudomonas aeruginosa]